MKSIVLFVLLCTSCIPPIDAKDAKEKAYTAALLRCIDQAETLEQSAVCRKSVDVQYGVSR